MNLLDIAILIIVALMTVRGFFRGIVQEAATLLGMIVSFFLAALYYKDLASWLDRFLPNHQILLSFFCFVFLFILCIFLFNFLAILARGAIRLALLGWLDRTLGGLFGLIKGAVIIFVLVTILTVFYPKSGPLVKNSRFFPSILTFTEKLTSLIPYKIKDDFLEQKKTPAELLGIEKKRNIENYKGFQKMKKAHEGRTTLDDLKDLVARLRGENGCPWDRKQTLESLKIYLLEETYELADALDRKAAEEVKEELGDLLFQVVFLSRLYEEEGEFDLSQVIEAIYRKMVRRHPHVFGDKKWENAEQVVQGWQDIKAGEKKGQDPFESIPVNVPSLLKAHRISQRAAGLGFDWPDIKGVLEKVREELRELEEAIRKNDLEAAGEELGDVLFSLVNVGRFLGVPAENALRKTIQKFLRRFRIMTDDPRFKDQGLPFLPIEEWEKLWARSKESE